MASIQGINNGTGDLAARASGVLSGLAKWQRQRRVYRDTVKELSALSGRDLADLGLNRSLIRRTALEAAGRA